MTNESTEIEPLPNENAAERAARIAIERRREADAARERARAAELAMYAERKTGGETYTAADWEFILAGVPENTRRTYGNAWKWILNWTGSHGYVEVPMPVETCVKMVRGHWHREGRYGRPAAPATLQLTLAVLTLAHRHAKRPDGTVGYVSPVQHPDVQRSVRTYRQQWLQAGHRPDQASPISPEELIQLVESCDAREERGARDALAMTLLYDMGARRSEALAVNFDDVDLVVRVPDDPAAGGPVDWTRPELIELYVPDNPDLRSRSDRLIVHVPMSKTDQEGAGDEVILLAHPAAYASTCPVRRYIAWRVLMAARDLECTGPVLRQVIGGGVKPKLGGPRKGTITGERMEVAGLESMLKRAIQGSGLADMAGRIRRHFALHGFRAGSIEASAEGGADTPEINRHYRLSQKGTTAQRYAARGLKRKRNPAARIWGSGGDGEQHG
jgi:integrase